jgi:enamine deaminase RidA (YjgF/YER057c/UK114 family)
MGKIEAKLQSMGHSLPEPFAFPSPNRRGAVRVGNILFVSGHGPAAAQPGLRITGKLGADMNVAEGQAAARSAALSILASVKRELGDLDRVRRVIRLFAMVNCTPDFGDQPRVIDGASDFFYELFGPEAGAHARSAVGMAALPRGMAVEINGEFEVA